MGQKKIPSLPCLCKPSLTRDILLSVRRYNLMGLARGRYREPGWLVFCFFFVIRQTAFGLIWNSADFVGSGRYTPIALLFKFIIHFYTFCLVLKQREWPGELHYTYVLYARLGGVSLIRTRVRPYLFSSLHLTITLACAATSDHSSRYFCDLHH